MQGWEQIKLGLTIPSRIERDRFAGLQLIKTSRTVHHAMVREHCKLLHIVPTVLFIMEISDI